METFSPPLVKTYNHPQREITHRYRPHSSCMEIGFTKQIWGLKVTHSTSTRSIEKWVGDETMKENQEPVVVLTASSFNAFEL